MYPSTMHPAELAEDSRRILERRICGSCGLLKLGGGSVDITLDTSLPHGRRALHAVVDVGILLAQRAFLQLFGIQVSKNLWIGKVQSKMGEVSKDWVSVRGKCWVVVRGTKEAGYR